MRSFVTKSPIKADQSGNVPSKINLLNAGTWKTPWHGDFELTGEDLKEMAANFEEGVGLVVEADTKAPVNYGHVMCDKAAGWIKRVYVEANDGAGAALMGDVEWTPAAVQAIKDGEWKYISPEFNPRGYPWEDPEQEFTFVDNVLTGAALTNIPLFKKLQPITASRVPPKKVKADTSEPTESENDKRNQGERMNVEDLRAKEVKDLTDEEKKFLTDNKDQLTADERTSLGIEDEPAPAPAPAPVETPAPTEAPAAGGDGTPVEASAIAGRVTELEKQLKASRDENEALRTKIETKEVNEFLDARIKAGQIKQDQKDSWSKSLLAARGDARTALETQLQALPANENIGKEVGDSGADVKLKASEQLDKEVRKIMADARAEGRALKYSEARKQVLDDNETLKSQLAEEDQ